MIQTYNIGDRMGCVSIGFSTLSAIFLGACRREESWVVSVLYHSDQSSVRQEYLLKPGDRMHFAREWIMRVDKNEAGKKTDRKANELRVSDVEPDALTVEVYVND